MAAFLVGITGGMASGKSTVVRWLGEAGFLVVDADQLVAELYAPGAPGSEAVRELFGDGFLAPDGSVDRQAVANIVFADESSRKRLEAAVHPLVHRRFREIAQRHHGVVIYEATLLVESGGSQWFDLVIGVEAKRATRLERAIGRGMEPAAAEARLVAQGDGTTRRKGVDRILPNDGTWDDLRTRVDSLITELRGHEAAASTSATAPDSAPQV